MGNGNRNPENLNGGEEFRLFKPKDHSWQLSEKMVGGRMLKYEPLDLETSNF